MKEKTLQKIPIQFDKHSIREDRVKAHELFLKFLNDLDDDEYIAILRIFLSIAETKI
jgi:hypothetical protein